LQTAINKKTVYPFLKFFNVVYEDNHLIVVNKRSGVLVQGDKTGDIPLAEHVKLYLKEKYNKPGNVFAGVVHRLDRPVSGLVLLAKTSKALERMNEMFKSRKIQKTYWAVVKRRPKDINAKLVHWLVKDTQKNVSAAYDEEVKDSLKAELSYKVLGKLNDHYLLEVNPITGRPHQIRVQLATIGCPIRGDIKYGFSKPNEDGSINLHARKLKFIHPVKQEPLTIIGSLPENEFWEQFLSLESKEDRNREMDNL
jgi:23S rRNA pseudouridine1911/1915/1917 synthase